MRAALTTVILLTVFIAGYHREQKTAQAPNIQKAAEQAPPKASSSVTHYTPKERKPSAYEKTKAYLWKATRPEFLAAWILVIAAGIGLVATFCTLKTIREQTGAVVKDADAALLSAQAAITASRPWFLIPHGGVGEPQVFPIGTDMGRNMTFCTLTTKNYGNTPGKIFASKAELQIGDSPSNPPNADVYEMKNAVHNIVTFPPGETIEYEVNLAPIGFITTEQRDAVFKTHNKFLWLCGFSRYRDTFEREHAPEYETRFCYVYETRTNAPRAFWRPAGPSEYNRAT